jgi:hypothetical protein
MGIRLVRRQSLSFNSRKRHSSLMAMDLSKNATWKLEDLWNVFEL